MFLLGQSGIYKKHQPQMEKASSFVLFVFFCSFGQPSLKPCAWVLQRGGGKAGFLGGGWVGRGFVRAARLLGDEAGGERC